MELLITCLLLGVLLGWKKLLPAKVIDHSGKIITGAIIFLLTTLGLKIGLDRQILNNLGEYGLQAFLFAVLTIVFSLFMVWALEKAFVKKNTLPEVKEFEVEGETEAHPYRMTCIILAAFFLGIVLGVAVVPTDIERYLPALTDAALYLTLLAVGIDLGSNKEMWKQFMSIGKYVFLAPLGVAVGSIIAGMIVGKFFGWTMAEGGAVGAGFGWYSLSGVIISEIHSVALGTIALLSNVIREILTIIITPLLARRRAKLILVAPGGATTMDTTLPVIAAVGPPGIAIVAFINGVVLSTLVPILVPLILG